MNPEDANRLSGPEQTDADEFLRRGIPWDVLAFWIIALSVWGFVLGYGITWLWRKVIG